MEGKGEMLSQFDRNRIAAIKEETEEICHGFHIWQEMKKAINEKCQWSEIICISCALE